MWSDMPGHRSILRRAPISPRRVLTEKMLELLVVWVLSPDVIAPSAGWLVPSGPHHQGVSG